MDLKKCIRSIPDFPKKGILFKDITTLLKNKKVRRGYWIRSYHPCEQAREVIRRFDLYSDIKPLSRCMICNGIVMKINNNSLITEPEPATKNEPEPATLKNYSESTRCISCNRIYRKGSQAIRLLRLIEGITEKNTKEWVKNQE